MTAPLWLVGLIPWAALAVYLLRGRPVAMTVPYLDLWPRCDGGAISSRAWRKPPAAVSAILLAILLAIVSAAGPRAGGLVSSAARPVILIVDRGITMSARVRSQPRFARLAADSAEDLARILGPGRATLMVIPGSGGQSIARGDWMASVAALEPTDVDTQALVAEAARRALLDPRAVVLVLSDQRIDVTDDRLVQIAPREKIENIGITQFTVRPTPISQAMVRVENDSHFRTASLRVTGADAATVNLPPSGTGANYFLDLSAAPQRIEATIDPGGDISADDSAVVVRRASWPTVAAAGVIPLELQRMLQVYRRHRPAGMESREISVLPLNANVAVNERAAIVVTEGAATVLVSGPAQWEPGPLTDGMDWNAATRQGRVGADQPGSGWRRLVWSGDQTLIAVKTEPVRQIWVGLRSMTWASTADYVLFWTKALDWLGEGADQYLPRNTIAAVGLDLAAPVDWQARLSALATMQTSDRADVSSWPLIAAAASLLIAAAALPRPTAWP